MYYNKLSTYLHQSVVLLLWTMRWYRHNQEHMIEGKKRGGWEWSDHRLRKFLCMYTVSMIWVIISNDSLLGDSSHSAIKRKSQIIQLHMHVHVASSPAYKHMMKLPTTIFRTRQKEPGDEANTNIALLSAMKQQSLMLLVAYAMTDFALRQLYSWCHEVIVYMITYNDLVPPWISLTCCLQKWKQETYHTFTWSTWYMELICINYTIPGRTSS